MNKRNGLELARIMPALSLATVVVSETSTDIETQNKLRSIIVFTEDVINTCLNLYKKPDELIKIKNNIHQFKFDFKLPIESFHPIDFL